MLAHKYQTVPCWLLRVLNLILAVMKCYMIVNLCKQLHRRLVMLVFRQKNYNFYDENCFFLSDDAKVHYYTGLTKCALLLSTFEVVMKPFCNGEKRAFYWRSFLLVLLKLRFNLGLQDIAYRLNILLASVSHLFHTTLDILMVRLEWLIKWPEREQLWKTVPICFHACMELK